MPKNTNKLIFGIPSKGRLKEQCEEWLASRGVELQQIGGSRSYKARFRHFPNIEVRLLSASEIAKSLLLGEIHIGITGEDIVREESARADDLIEFIAKLGFGNADIVVAVPNGWIDVTSMADLAEVASEFRKSKSQRLRVATKFNRVTIEFFQKHGVVDYRLVKSLGATEGAPANGVAEIIVDITTSGSTLVANNLKILDDGLILASQANLMLSKTAYWPAQLKEEYITFAAHCGLKSLNSSGN